MRRTLTLLCVLTLLVGALALPAASSTLPNSATWTGQGSGSLHCEKLGERPERTEAGWIHWIVNQASGIAEAELALSGSGSGTYLPTKYGPVVEFFTPYYDVATLAATLHYAGSFDGNFVISDYCPGGYEELTVAKTADTYFNRRHAWDIDKQVETEHGHEKDGVPKVWLYTDGSGDETATWTVDVTYEGFEDTDHIVSGTITIDNTGTLDAVLTGVWDVLAGELAYSTSCGVTFPYTLPVGETLTCYYDEDGYVEGFNVVTVVTERDEYVAQAPIIWGDPDHEFNKTVHVRDVSDLFGDVGLGTVTAPDDARFTYTKDLAFEDYDECEGYEYDNTGYIVETQQWADATLKVNVQCYVYEGETVTGAGLPWSAVARAPRTWFEYTPVDVLPFTTDLIQGAKRNVVGDVSIQIAGIGRAELCFDLDEDAAGTPWVLDGTRVDNVKVQPLQAPPTRYVPPGRFSERFTEGGSAFCVEVPVGQYGYAIHLDAASGMPDPDFGPTPM